MLHRKVLDEMILISVAISSISTKEIFSLSHEQAQNQIKGPRDIQQPAGFCILMILIEMKNEICDAKILNHNSYFNSGKHFAWF